MWNYNVATATSQNNFTCVLDISLVTIWLAINIMGEASWVTDCAHNTIVAVIIVKIIMVLIITVIIVIITSILMHMKREYFESVITILELSF